MSYLPTVPSRVGRKCVHSGNSHMVYGVMKNWAKACTVHRWGQRVGLLTVDLDRLQARKCVRSVRVQMRRGEATCFPFSSPSMSSKGCGCYASLRNLHDPSLSLELQSHSDKPTRHRKPHSQSSILDHLKYWYFSRAILFCIGTIHIEHPWNPTICPSLICMLSKWFLHTQLSRMCFHSQLNESPWVTIHQCESHPGVMWISLNLVLSSYQCEPCLLRALFYFPS